VLNCARYTMTSDFLWRFVLFVEDDDEDDEDGMMDALCLLTGFTLLARSRSPAWTS